MEIEVGEYVRTNKGNIAKVTDIDNLYVYADETLGYSVQGIEIIENDYILKTNITNHSKNIIDLIQVGDVVEVFSELHELDGIQVYRVVDENHLFRLKKGFEKGYFKLISILTHEKYEKNCYKVVE